MMIRLTAPVVGIIALSVGCIGIASAQNSIGFQFVGGGGTGATKSLAPNDKAGVPTVAQTHWNPLQDCTGNATKIMTDDGQPTNVKLNYNCPNTWTSILDVNANPNNALLGGYLDTSDTADASSIETLTFTGIPFAKYDVYVYVYGEATTEHRQGIYKIGSATLKLTDFGAFTGTFKAPTDKDPIGNYVVFKGITGANFVLTGAPGDSDGTPRAPINAVQIVKE